KKKKKFKAVRFSKIMQGAQVLKQLCMENASTPFEEVVQSNIYTMVNLKLNNHEIRAAANWVASSPHSIPDVSTNDTVIRTISDMMHSPSVNGAKLLNSSKSSNRVTHKSAQESLLDTQKTDEVERTTSLEEKKVLQPNMVRDQIRAQLQQLKKDEAARKQMQSQTIMLNPTDSETQLDFGHVPKYASAHMMESQSNRSLSDQNHQHPLTLSLAFVQNASNIEIVPSPTPLSHEYNDTVPTIVMKANSTILVQPYDEYDVTEYKSPMLKF
ncbi:hypothetical protein RFI_15564, partial [Reticulomyxa filosa]